MMSKEYEEFEQETDQSTGSGYSDNGMRIFSYLLAGIICYGALGWLLDAKLGTKWLTPLGIVFGLACSIYLVVKKYVR